MRKQPTPLEKRFTVFWDKFFELKHPGKQNAWTLSFFFKGKRVVEHEMNVVGSMEETEAKFKRLVQENWPGKLPKAISINHVTPRSLDFITGKYKTSPVARANFVLLGVPKKALDALRDHAQHGGKPPKDALILRHFKP